MATYLSGIQPTGLPHLGNFFGAIAQHIALQEQGGEHFYFIADLHALTTTPEPVPPARSRDSGPRFDWMLTTAGPTRSTAPITARE